MVSEPQNPKKSSSKPIVLLNEELAMLMRKAKIMKSSSYLCQFDQPNNVDERR